MKRVLNLGAGTQSSVLLVMADKGEIPPVEVAIFADTQAEPREVYEHLAWLEKQVKTPVVRVSKGNLRDAILTPRTSKKSGRIWAKGIPYWTRDRDGKLGLFVRGRQCTVDYKIEEINRWIKRNYVPRALRNVVCVDRVFGISYDEMSRRRVSRDTWAVNTYPLVEMRLDRKKVIEMARRWFPGHEFPRSACTFCPYHSNAEWRRIRDMPEEWKSAIEVDEAARALHSHPNAAMRAEVFLHRSGLPLRLAILEDPKPEPGLFDQDGMENECQGMCGV